MRPATWPPSIPELRRDLDALRLPGILRLPSLDLPALADAARRLEFMIGDAPDIEVMLREVCGDLGEESEPCRAARALYGLDLDRSWRGLPHKERAYRAGEACGVSAQTFSKKKRALILDDLARAIFRRVTKGLDDVATRTGQAVPGPSYSPVFKNWDKLAWVRKKDRNTEPFDGSLDFFSRDLVPMLALPQAASLTEAEQREILVYHLYNYLEFTVRLETGPVNEVASLISEQSFLEWLPPEMKDDALRVYTDEGGHAEMSNELMRRVREYTGLEPLRAKPQFLAVLRKLQQERLEIEHNFVKLFFVIVSETLITGSLNRLPRDETVQDAVRHVARDHALDEGRHHKYFSQLLAHIWPRLTHPLKYEVVSLFPHLIHAFLDIDRGATRAILRRYPGSFPDPGRALSDLESLEVVHQGLRSSAEPTVQLLSSVGVLDFPGAKDLFVASGLMQKGSN